MLFSVTEAALPRSPGGCRGRCPAGLCGFGGPGPHTCALSCHYPGRAPALNTAKIEVKASTQESVEGRRHGDVRENRPSSVRPRGVPDAGLTFPAAGCPGCCRLAPAAGVLRALLSAPASGWGASVFLGCLLVSISTHTHTHAHAHMLTQRHMHAHARSHTPATGPAVEVPASHGPHAHSQLIRGTSSLTLKCQHVSPRPTSLINSHPWAKPPPLSLNEGRLPAAVNLSLRL